MADHRTVLHRQRGYDMRKSIRRVSRTALAFAAAVVCSRTGAITVTVNQSTTYQTIEAIGTAQNPATYTTPWKYRSGPFYVQVDLDAVHFYDTVIVDGGFTGMRCQEPLTSFQQTRGDFSLSAGNRTELQTQARFQQAARRAGEPFALLWNTFSPPPWMKANNSCCDTTGGLDPNNYLLAEHYVDFANHWIRAMEIARDSFGVTVDFISLQNEPLFNEPYVSCNYTLGPGCGWNGVCYNNMFKVVAPLIRAAFPAVRFVASEDLNRTTVEANLRADPISNPLVYAWATHNDFVTSFQYVPDRPIWQTEPHSNGFLNEAQMCMANLAAGAGVWLTGANGGRTNGCCDTVGTNGTECMQKGVYSSLKMFARYVRPGARRIGSSGGVSGNYGVMAFYHPGDVCLTIVLINATGTTEPATLSVSGSYQPAQFDAFYSTATEDEVPAGTVAVNGTYTMPPYSVSTLVAGTYRGTPTAISSPARTSAGPVRQARARAGRLYTVDGRVASSVRRPLAPGLYCADAEGARATGRALVVVTR